MSIYKLTDSNHNIHLIESDYNIPAAVKMSHVEATMLRIIFEHEINNMSISDITKSGWYDESVDRSDLNEHNNDLTFLNDIKIKDKSLTFIDAINNINAIIKMLKT